MRTSRKALCALSTAAIAAVGWADQALGANITAGDLIVFQQSTTGNAGVNIQLDEFSTSGTTVQTFTDTNLYTDSAHSEGYLSLSDGGSEISYDGYTSSASTENNVTSRAVGVLNLNGTISYPAGTTYTSTAGKNARSAYSADGVNWYQGDQNSLYYNGTALTGGPSSTHSLVAVGGMTYSFTGNSISAITPNSPTPGTTSVSLTAVTTDPGGALQDFTLISSQNNGVYDTLYMSDGTGSTNADGAIYKFADIAGTWTPEGDVAFSGSTIGGHAPEDITAEEVGGNVEIFLTANSGSHGWLYEMTDTSGSPTSNISLGSATLLDESGSNDQFNGVVIVPEPVSLCVVPVMAFGLLLRRRRPTAS